MVFLFVDGKVLNACIVSIKIGQCTPSKGVPHNDVTFFPARGDESMSGAVNERVDSFLMKIESLSFVRNGLNIVDVNESIKRAADYIVEIGVVLDLRNPTLMDPSAFLVNAFHNFSHLNRLDLHFFLSHD